MRDSTSLASTLTVPTSIGYGASFGGLSALLAMLNSCAAGVSVDAQAVAEIEAHVAHFGRGLHAGVEKGGDIRGADGPVEHPKTARATNFVGADAGGVHPG